MSTKSIIACASAYSSKMVILVYPCECDAVTEKFCVLQKHDGSSYVLIHLRSIGFKLYPVLVDYTVSEKNYLYYCFYSFRFDYLLSYYTSLFLLIKLLILDIYLLTLILCAVNPIKFSNNASK